MLTAFDQRTRASAKRPDEIQFRRQASRIASRRHWLWIALCSLALCGASCNTPQKPNLMGDGFHDDFAKDGETIRPAQPPSGEFDGVSTKSQQVERDLGIR